MLACVDIRIDFARESPIGAWATFSRTISKPYWILACPLSEQNIEPAVVLLAQAGRGIKELPGRVARLEVWHVHLARADPRVIQPSRQTLIKRV